MATYTQWFEVVHEAAPDGMSNSQRGSLTKDLAEYWHNHKREIQNMTKSEARDLAQRIVR